MSLLLPSGLFRFPRRDSMEAIQRGNARVKPGRPQHNFDGP
jgi:hypothetical protein